MKYRIYQDGNGFYLIKRKKFLFWQALDWYQTWGGEFSNSNPCLFSNKEEVVEFLNKEEKSKQYVRNAKIRNLITEINPNKYTAICVNCNKEIEEVK